MRRASRLGHLESKDLCKVLGRPSIPTIQLERLGSLEVLGDSNVWSRLSDTLPPQKKKETKQFFPLFRCVSMVFRCPHPSMPSFSASCARLSGLKLRQVAGRGHGIEEWEARGDWMGLPRFRMESSSLDMSILAFCWFRV